MSVICHSFSRVTFHISRLHLRSNSPALIPTVSLDTITFLLVGSESQPSLPRTSQPLLQCWWHNRLCVTARARTRLILILIEERGAKRTSVMTFGGFAMPRPFQLFTLLLVRRTDSSLETNPSTLSRVFSITSENLGKMSRLPVERHVKHGCNSDVRIEEWEKERGCARK